MRETACQRHPVQVRVVSVRKDTWGPNDDQGLERMCPEPPSPKSTPPIVPETWVALVETEFECVDAELNETRLSLTTPGSSETAVLEKINPWDGEIQSRASASSKF
jgi:hypothetical protein